MILVTSNKAKRLLSVQYIGNVQLEDFRRSENDLLTQMRELSTGFTLLGDFTPLDSMTPECVPEIGRIMEVLTDGGVARVIRIIPHAGKDVGLNILSAFHYRKQPHIVTVKTLAEAGSVLNL